MSTFASCLQVICRLALAALLGGFALSGLWLLTAQAAIPLVPAVPPPGLTEAALRALLAVIAIWLAFGIRTRVVALLGLVLFAAALRLQSHGALIDLGAGWQFTAAAGLALPLLIGGGGRFSLYRAGWRNPF